MLNGRKKKKFAGGAGPIILLPSSTTSKKTFNHPHLHTSLMNKPIKPKATVQDIPFPRPSPFNNNPFHKPKTPPIATSNLTISQFPIEFESTKRNRSHEALTASDKKKKENQDTILPWGVRRLPRIPGTHRSSFCTDPKSKIS